MGNRGVKMEGRTGKGGGIVYCLFGDKIPYCVDGTVVFLVSHSAAFTTETKRQCRNDSSRWTLLDALLTFIRRKTKDCVDIASANSQHGDPKNTAVYFLPAFSLSS